MGIVDGFTAAPLTAKIAFVLLFIAALFGNLGFTTPAWIKVENPANDEWIGYGLWRACSTVAVASSCAHLDGQASEWMGAVQAMAIFGFVGINVALLLVILYIWVESCGCKGNKENAIGTAILCILTAICYLIAVAIYGTKYDDNKIVKKTDYSGLSWSFGLVICASVLELVAGVLMLLTGLKGNL